MYVVKYNQLGKMNLENTRRRNNAAPEAIHPQALYALLKTNSSREPIQIWAETYAKMFKNAFSS